MLRFSVICVPLVAIFARGVVSAGSITTVDVPGAVNTYLLGISNNGVAVGDYTDSSGNFHGFERLVNGTLVSPLDDPAGAGNPQFFNTQSSGVNNVGTITGEYGYYPPGNAFILSGGVYNAYSFSGCGNSVGGPTRIGGINDNGDVAGSCGIGSSSLESGYIQIAGQTPVVFSLPGALETFGGGLNNLDQVVGGYLTPSGTVREYGFIWNMDGTYTLIACPGTTGTSLSGINDAGIFVGGCDSTAFYGTVGNLIPFSIPGETQVTLNGINNSGELVGSYVDSNFIVHGFITTLATPEPSSVFLGAIGLLGLLALRKR